MGLLPSSIALLQKHNGNCENLPEPSSAILSCRIATHLCKCSTHRNPLKTSNSPFAMGHSVSSLVREPPSTSLQFATRNFETNANAVARKPPRRSNSNFSPESRSCSGKVAHSRNDGEWLRSCDDEEASGDEEKVASANVKTVRWRS